MELVLNAENANKSMHLPFIESFQDGGKEILLRSETQVWSSYVSRAALSYACKQVSYFSTSLNVKSCTHLWHILEEHRHTPAHHASLCCFVRTVTVELPARLTYERLT